MCAEGLHICTFPHDMREPRTGRGSHAVADARKGASAKVRGSGLDRSVDVLGQSGLGLLDDGLEGLGIGAQRRPRTETSSLRIWHPFVMYL